MANYVAVQFLLAGFTDNSGNPLNGGKVYTYAAGTSTPKDTYTTVAGGGPEANPIILDSNGRKQVFADGSYKFVVKTSADVTLYTFDNVNFSPPVDFDAQSLIDIGDASTRTGVPSYGQIQDGKPVYVATVGGTGDAITLTPSPAITSYVAGRELKFFAAASNTTTTAVNVNSVGSRAIKKKFGGAVYDLSANDIVAGQFVELVDDGTQFLLKDHGGIIDRTATAVEVTNTTTETALYTKSILGNTLGTHRRIILEALLELHSDGVNPTFTLRFKYGATTLVTWSQANMDDMAGTNKVVVKIRAVLVANASASAQKAFLEWTGYEAPANAGTATPSQDALSGSGAVQRAASNSASEVSTGALTLQLTAQWSAASTHTCKLMEAVLKFE